jgi:hypothetical protein
MNVTEQLTEVEDRFFEGLTNLQTQFVEANTKVADRIHDLDLPTPDVEPVIAPADAVARYYDFAGKLMDSNRKFVEQMISVWYPAPAAKATTAKKTAARKTTAKASK